MAGYNLFSTSTLGMMAQAYSLNVIGNNVANMTTGGFKGTEVRFSSLLSRPLFEQSDLGGVRPIDVYSVDKQGAVVATPRVLDVSIAGRGMFALNTEFDGSGEALYTRDGSFELRVGDPITLTDDDGNAVTSNEMYLVDKNGYYVMGAERQTDGSFAIPGTVGGIRLDTYAFTDVFEPSGAAAIRLNLPAGADAGDDVQYNISLVDSEGVLQTPDLLFSKADGNNQWYLTSSAMTQVAQVSTVTLAGTPEGGDVYSVRIGATTVSYTSTGLKADIDKIATNLAAAVNGNGTLGSLVTAAATAGGAITLTGEKTNEPTFGLPAMWIDEANREEAMFRGYTVVDPATVITTHLTEVIKDNMAESLSYTETQKLLDDLDKSKQKLVGDLIPTQISLGGVQRILQNLLSERISIRDLPTILEAVSEACAHTRSVLMITEHVRARLARQISDMNTNDQGFVPLITLAPSWEQTFAESLVGAGDDKQLAMAPSKLQEFIQALRSTFERQAGMGEQPVLLTSPPIRPYVHSIVERFRPTTVVMSQNEIHPKARIKTVAQI